MNPEDNPFLKLENPYENIKQASEEVTKVQMELQQLCWQVFHVEPHGKRLMELLKERYLMRPLFTPDHPQSSNLCMFWEGFREAIRGFDNLGKQHQQYVNGVTNVGNSTTNSASTIT